MTPALCIQHLHFAYDRRPILADVNLKIDKGSFVGIIGPNGGGKTTLFRLILGFLRPNSGTISIFGQPVANALDTLAYVPQGLSFDRAFPISTLELVLGGRLRGAPWIGRYPSRDRKAAKEALARVGLADEASAPFSALSGGQAQRALIARALVSNPRLLLLDEPTANVDAQAEADIYQLLQSLKGSTTVLLVTHDFGVATTIVDEVVCVQQRVDRLEQAQVCEHFAMGIYHDPLPTKEEP